MPDGTQLERISMDSDALTFQSSTKWVDALHRFDRSTLLTSHRGCSECMADKAIIPVPLSISDTSSSDDSDKVRPRRRHGKHYSQLGARAFVGVMFSGCTLAGGTGQSKKMGISYQKRNCEIKAEYGDKVIVRRIADSDLDDQ